MTEQTKTTETCNHAIINTWAFSETGEPAKFWSCARCKLRFVPISELTKAEAERDEAREALRGCVEHMEHSTPQGKAAWERASDVLERSKIGGGR